MTTTPAPPRQRMSKHDRRRQLLDALATGVVEHGCAEVSMERLAAWAGVSKALPYAHFDNVEAALVALYQREQVRAGRQLTAALERAAPGEDLVAIRVRSYFDAMAERADVLRALTSPGSSIPAMADPDGEGARFTAGLLYRYHGLSKERALAVSGIVRGAISSAVETWIHGLASRETLETALIAVIRAIAEAPEDQDTVSSNGRDSSGRDRR